MSKMKVEPKKITVRELTDGYVDDAENGVRGFGGKLDIRPPYQREFIYKPQQRVKVIDTVEKGYPLNTMYWAVRDNGEFEIIDGQQRTVSLCRYVDGRFSVGDLFDNREAMYFHNLTSEEQKRILDYELNVYLCSGEKRELLKWFETINIAGEELTRQEILNAVFSGEWVTAAKKYFSKRSCPAFRIGGKYLSGSPIRQDYLATVLGWAAGGGGDKIEKYMGNRQNHENAQELRKYFESVIDWVQKVFPEYSPEMKGIAWGDLHRAYGNETFDAERVKALEAEVARLMDDEEIDKKSGIYFYLLTGEERHLNFRQFTLPQKRKAFNRQKGNRQECVCPGFPGHKCGKSFDDFRKMEGDHITPWSEGGKTTDDNCQMLCKSCNRQKSNK